MNIFVLDEQPEIAAQMMCDKHVVKMIVESCQLMSTAHHVLDGEQLVVDTGKRKYTTSICTKKNICKATMINHPCSIWVRESRKNYMWLWKHAYSLCKEYSARYGKVHSMEAMLMDGLYSPPVNIPRGKRTQFVQAMPDQYKNENPVIGYRQYYLAEKTRFAKWKTGVIPAWFSASDPLLGIFDEALLPF
jgi:hypothetical protein